MSKTSSNDQTRRALMTSLAALSLGGAAHAAGNSSETKPAQGGSSILVAYFSRTGNTRVVAGLIRRATGSDIFEIQPAVAYPEDYLATVEQARVERNNGTRPALAATIPGIARYQTVYLGFPIWGETAPPVIRAFLGSHDMSGMTIIPFITHGGYGLGNSETVLARHAPQARLARAFLMQGDQERQTMDRVNGWLNEARVAR
ncbi:flavodoxin [Variovorax saccharolyticus]|uniref:flavodoxin n=1 Tax=Variovorax saccharolyticus TaxID=3053516 RepID=UPI002578B20E|nr:flavodoxin [Variovorax sp. J22R187]MDM0021850.1 flavodoxin [Variovorax sp. J22R187]